jgi:hypothetical protein
VVLTTQVYTVKPKTVPFPWPCTEDVSASARRAHLVCNRTTPVRLYSRTESRTDTSHACSSAPFACLQAECSHTECAASNVSMLHAERTSRKNSRRSRLSRCLALLLASSLIEESVPPLRSPGRRGPSYSVFGGLSPYPPSRRLNHLCRFSRGRFRASLFQ